MTISSDSVKTILFVCTGNICRSPMATAFLRAQIEQRNNSPEQYHTYSAGLLDLYNQPASPFAVRVMQEQGLDIGAHQARELTAVDVANADLILTMTAAQKEVIQLEFPEHRHKVHMLSEMLYQQYDIEDPYGAPLDAYRYVADEISGIIEEGYERLVALVKAEQR